MDASIENNQITSVPRKDKFVEFTTPEFIKFDLLQESSSSLDNKRLRSLVEYSLHLSTLPAVCHATNYNTKLTYPQDLAYLEGLLVDSSNFLNVA